MLIVQAHEAMLQSPRCLTAVAMIVQAAHSIAEACPSIVKEVHALFKRRPLASFEVSVAAALAGILLASQVLKAFAGLCAAAQLLCV